MIGVQRQLKAEGKDYRAFEILNLGKYERQHYIGVNPNLREAEQQKQLEEKEAAFVDLILRAYRAEKTDGLKTFHGKKTGRLVAVGPVNLPVTRLFVEEVILECRKMHITRVDILGFEFEMGLFPNVLDEARAKGIDIAPKYIPAEVFDKRAVEKNQVVFHGVAAIEVKPHVRKNNVAVELTDFSVFYSQDSIASVEATLKNKGSKIVAEKGQIVKVSKDAMGIVKRDRITKKWTDWIDYWAVDFNFENKREIVRIPRDKMKQVQIPGMEQPEQVELPEYEEVWTGDYIFENEWQSFRTKKDRSLELTSVFHECTPGRRKLAVKVVDIFGNDTHDHRRSQCGREEIMALHSNFPGSPYSILDPSIRWFPADEALRETSSEKLMPPLVPQLRKKVKEWRDSGYVGATDTSKSLLNWWFNTPHLLPQTDGTMTEFQYYFAQREALETIVYLYDVVGVQDKYDLMRFDSSGAVSTGMFDEAWRRFVAKMATGTGKTKLLSLVLAWSFFHKLYEPESELSRNFLVIAPNIIVLDRIYKDFNGLRIFFADPVLPDNGVNGRNWRDDFQLTLHRQDEVRITRPTGNIFLTNIHRVYAGGDIPASPDDDDTMDYFLGKRPTGATTDSKVDLGMIVRDIDELIVLNRRGTPHSRPAHGMVQIHRRHPQPLEAKRVGPFPASGCDGYAQAQQRRDFRADRLRLPTGGSYLAKRGQASGAAGRRQPCQVNGTEERQVHREIRRLHSPGRNRVAQGVCRARKAGQESHLVRDDR